MAYSKPHVWQGSGNTSTVERGINMLTTGNATVDAIGQVHFEGNVIPHQWFTKITFENGKSDLIGIMILSEIVYWYRPVYVKHEASGQLKQVKKRFKADLLQRSYDSFAEQFGITKRQATDAIKRLEAANLVKRHFRNIQANNTTLANVLFIELLHSNVINLTFGSDTSHVRTWEVSHSNVTPLTSECKTYTEITTEITTKKNNVEQVDIAHEIINYLNSKANKQYRATTAATKRLINGRLADGYTLEDFKRVIDLKVQQWLHNPEMNKYLRPDTLFNATKFEAYLNEGPANKTPQTAQQSPQPPILDFSAGEDL